MPKPMQILLLILGGFFMIIAVVISGLLVYLTLNEFRPSEKMALSFRKDSGNRIRNKNEFSILTWNIGYAGLGAKMDFFYDGGSMVRPGKQESDRCLEGICRLLQSNDTVDFLLLQEVDRGSKRSWNTDQLTFLGQSLPGKSFIFGPNYNCPYVPVPLWKPMGPVHSGIVTFSGYPVEHAFVTYFPCMVPWPKRLVYLKRCYTEIRYRLDNGKELILINTHNSAFDSSGKMRKEELYALRTAMEAEFGNGNFVIAGGDWNMNPPGFKPEIVRSGDVVIRTIPPMDSVFIPGWQVIFDPTEPTNRNVDIPYLKGVIKTTIIDYFILSPNVEMLTVKTIPMGFSVSDHQPVVIKVRLR